MRFVQLGIKPEAEVAFERFYDHRIRPALLKVEGCVFANLIRSTDNEPEFISFTLWQTQAHAQNYERSGQYADLLKENEPFQSVSNEWKIQLNEDNTLEYKPVATEPDVKVLPIVAGSSEKEAPEKLTGSPYIRLLNAKVNPDRFEELSKVYADVITPALLKTPGCQAAYLIGTKENHEGLSVTIWESKEKALEYEESGKFAELLDKALPFLSSLYQWKMTLDPKKQRQMHSSDEVSIKGYQIASRKD